MRVRDFLEIGLLREAGVRVVAAEEHLDRPIRWVHTGEIADIAQYLTGGEALLTALTGLPDEVAERRRYIRELGEVDVACVIVELGRGLNEIPPEMVEEADHSGLVLAVLDSEVPFVAVTQQAHTTLVVSAHSTLQAAMAIDDVMSAMILDGAPLATVLELLAERLRNPVILEDGARHVVAHGGSAASAAPLLHHWQAHARQNHRLDRTAAVQQAAGEHRCAWAPVTVRGEDWGRLHVIEADVPLDDLTRLVLARATASIGLMLMSERDAVLSDTAEHSLIGGLTARDRFNGRDFLARASGLGMELPKELVALTIALPEGTELGPDTNLPDLTRRALRENRWVAIVGKIDGAVVIVAGVEEGRDHFAATQAVASTLTATLGIPVQVGVSRPGSAAALPSAFTEARTALRLGPLTQSGPVHTYEGLVLYRLLAPLASGPALANFVEEELGPLLSQDEQVPGEMLRTLTAYLESNGNKIATAQRLHLQRRSVYYRLDRIQEALGRSLDNPEERVRLYLAVRAHKILQAEEAV